MICILRWNSRKPFVLLRQEKEMALMTNGWKSKNEKSAIRPIDVNYHYVLSNRLLIVSSLLSFTLRSDAKSKNKWKFEIRRWEGRGLGPVIGMLVGKGIVLLKRCEDASKNGLGWLGTDSEWMGWFWMNGLRTDGLTNGWTDQWMDTPTYRDARTHLIMVWGG